jgi:predicted extracellular nuclease
MPLFIIFLFSLALLTPIQISSHSTLGHVVISEIQVSGGTASDEFVELVNPTDCPVSLEGWKLTKKTSTGNESNLVSNLTGTIPAHGFFLITHQTGYDGPVVADLTYSGATYSIANNNTVLLYADQDKVQLVDKVGFADPDKSVEAEGSPAPNPPANGSLERISSQDNDLNSADFTLREVSDPQNSQSPLVGSPGQCSLPPPPSSPVPSSPTPSLDEEQIARESIMTIADARQKPNGETVKVEGTVTVKPGQLSALTMYIQDDSAGMQIYTSKKTFPQLTTGNRVRVRGDLSEAYNERRLKIVAQSDVEIIGSDKVSPLPRKTGEIGEKEEGILVSLSGAVTETSGSTFYIDDGSGERKIYIKKETGIEKPRMKRGDQVVVTGIVSQYKSDYRLLPREQKDLKVSSASEQKNEDEGVGTINEEESTNPSGQVESAITFAPTAGDFLSPKVMSKQSKKIWLGRGMIAVGAILFLLIPFLVWAKKSNWLPNRLARLKNFFAKSPLN